MANIPTGHFVAITGGSFLLGSLFTLFLFKLFKFRLPIKMFGRRDVRHERVEERPTVYHRRPQKEEARRSVYEAYLIVPREKIGNARHLIHDFRGDVVSEIGSDKYRSVLDVAISPENWEYFKKVVGEVDYVLAAYGHYGSRPGPVIKTEGGEYKQPPRPTPPVEPLKPKDMFDKLIYMATDEGWGGDEDEIFRSKDRFLLNLYDYGVETGSIRSKPGEHPQYKKPYTTTDADPIFGFLIHWGKAELYETLYRNLTSDPQKGRMMLEEVNRKRRDAPFRNAKEVKIEWERHRNYAMRNIKEGFVEKNKKRILELIKKLSGNVTWNN